MKKITTSFYYKEIPYNRMFTVNSLYLSDGGAPLMFWQHLNIFCQNVDAT